MTSLYYIGVFEFDCEAFDQIEINRNSLIYKTLSCPKVIYSQTCFSDHLSTKATFVVSLENGFSLNHVLKEPVYKGNFLCFPWAVAIDRFDCITSSSLVLPVSLPVCLDPRLTTGVPNAPASLTPALLLPIIQPALATKMMNSSKGICFTG